MENVPCGGNHSTDAQVGRQHKRRSSSSVTTDAEAEGVDALLDCRVGLPSMLPSYSLVESRRDAYQGPTDESNWVIPGRLLAGAYPAEVDDAAHKALLRSILACGVTTFVCLQDEYRHNSSDPAQWAAGREIRPYIRDAHALCSAADSSAADSSADGVKLPPADRLTFLHLPVADCGTAPDDTIRELAEALCWRLVAGEVLYVHCWGGHGRTGTVVACMLGMLYDISHAEALKRTQLYHDLRAATMHVPSPQTFAQRMQVLRVLDACREEPRILQRCRDDQAVAEKQRRAGARFELAVCGGTEVGKAGGREAPSKHGLEEEVAHVDKCRRLLATGGHAGRSTRRRVRSLRPPVVGGAAQEEQGSGAGSVCRQVR